MTQPLRVGGVVSAAIALGVVLAGCGSNTTTGAATTSPETATSSAVEETETATSETTSGAPTTSASGANYTIADYVRDNNITETIIHRGDPGTPTVNLPTPPGWEDAGTSAPDNAWGALIYADPSAADDPPTVVAIMTRMTGNVDPAKIIEYAGGATKNLPGYGNESDGKATTLSGFDAYQIGGTYQQDGTRLFAQKTVVIPGQDGLYVLQLNAEGPEEQFNPLMDATAAIDDETTITP